MVPEARLGTVGEERFMQAQAFYRAHDSMHDGDDGSPQLGDLPRRVVALCAIVQGVLIHRDIAPWLYDLNLSQAQRDLANIRPVGRMIEAIQILSARPLGERREPAERLPVVCRHFSSLLAALLREHGVPARARCGFGAYFNPGRFEDHWVAEYWNRAEHRWVLVDAQLDDRQRGAFRVDFDPVDVPHDRFILAANAWRQCRAGHADPDRFGLSLLNEQGLWWIAGNLIRDLAALNRVEMLPWDVWGMMPRPSARISEDQAALLDQVAALTLGGDAMFVALQDLYKDERLKVPRMVFNADRKIEEAVSGIGDPAG